MNVEQAFHPFNEVEFRPRSLKYHNEIRGILDNVNSGYLDRFKSFPLMAFYYETKD
jgi:hypothetical protein